MQNTSNFNLILSNEITAGVYQKFFTLTLNGLKAIAANQEKHEEWLLDIAIPNKTEYYSVQRCLEH